MYGHELHLDRLKRLLYNSAGGSANDIKFASLSKSVGKQSLEM